jgi:hypothetical protein
MYNRVSIHNDTPVSQKQSFESVKYFTYWITIKRAFPNIQVTLKNGAYQIDDPTDPEYKYVLGAGNTIDSAIECTYTNKEVIRRLTANK